MGHKVLITGAGGFLGREIARQCQRRGYEVMGSLERPHDFIPSSLTLSGDLTAQKATRSCDQDLMAHRYTP